MLSSICKTCHRAATHRGLCDTCRAVPVPAVRQPRRSTSLRGRAPHPIANSRQWRRLRKALLTDSPLCARCTRMGRPRPAAHIDHILPARHYPAKLLALDNLQPLCQSCHAVKTGGERRGWAYDYQRGIAYDIAGGIHGTG